MNTRPAIVLQDVFLNQVRKEKIGVTIHLVNGFQLKGTVRGFDNFVIIFESEGKQMMVYKHAVSTLTSAKHIVFTSEHSDERQDAPKS